MNKLDKIIVEILENQNNKPISRKALIDRIQLISKELEPRNIFHSLRYLEKNKKIIILQNGRVVLEFNPGNVIEGSNNFGNIFINSHGDGFIKNINNGKEIYIHKNYIKDALNGDTVEYIETDGTNWKKIQNGIVVKVNKRSKDFFVGEFIQKDINEYQVILDDYKNNKKIIIQNPSGLVNGYKILLKAIEYKENSIIMEVIKIIGHKNDPGVDILSILNEHKIDIEFPHDVLEEANSFSKEISLEEKKNRKDLTNLPFITIDPETSKDLDDAIYVRKENENYRLWVSIADVSHYLKMNSELDKEALKRGTSIYLINKVIPMCPHILSNDICSLNPNEERLTLTCEMLINNNGNFDFIDVYPSIFISKRRFSYTEVNDFYKGDNKLLNENDEIKNLLNISYELFKILRNNFKNRGYIDFEIKEPKIILDKNEKPSEIIFYERGDAQMMIENFMVAANEAVTINFQKYDLPFIYRIHDKPDSVKLKNFAIEAKKLNFKIDSEINNIKPNTISKWILDNSNNPSWHLVNKLLLRVMAKAEYSTKNIGHFGLASKFYTHFTSPIRRYPDVIVHRLYRMFVFEKHLYSNEERSFLLSKLNEICKLSSENENIANSIEREVTSLKFVEYMSNHTGEFFNGTISHITNFGIFIELENSIEGLCKLANIKIDDFFIYNSENNTYIGEKTKIVLSFGKLVKIRVIGSDIFTKKIDFEIIQII